MAAAKIGQAFVWRQIAKWDATRVSDTSALAWLRLLAGGHQDLLEDPSNISLTARALAERYSREAGESEPSNALSRAYYPSLPVIHVAMAFESLAGGRLFPNVLLTFDTLLDVVVFPKFVTGVLLNANIFARLIADTPELQEAARNLICFQAI